MKIVGFTIIRNAIKYDYPIVEAIASVLPLCDEFVVSVGNSEDDTLNLIRGISSDKIKIVDSVWDDSIRNGGRILAVETDKAFAAVPPDADWVFYIQADEALHEQYHATVRAAMEQHLNDASVDGLLFNYLHFYGSYDYIGESWSWYRREIRVVRNNRKIFSYRDAQGFRKRPNDKLRVKLIDAFIYHYGWVREPSALQRKQINSNVIYKGGINIGEMVARGDEFDYSGISALERFIGTHPSVMQDRIRRKNWGFDFDVSKKSYTFKEKVKRFLGFRIGEYKNYKLV